MFLRGCKWAFCSLSAKVTFALDKGVLQADKGVMGDMKASEGLPLQMQERIRRAEPSMHIPKIISINKDDIINDVVVKIVFRTY